MKKSRNNIILIGYIKYTKYILSLFIFISIIIKTGTTNKFKSFKLSNNYYYIIKQDGIYYSKIEYNINKLLFSFNETQLTEEDIEMASFAEFKDNSKAHNLILIKNNLYALLNDEYYCNLEIENNNEKFGYSLIYPFKCNDLYCNFIFVKINSQNELILKLYEKSLNNCTLRNYMYTDLKNSNIEHYLINCQFSSGGELIICFYQNNKSEIKSEIYNITLNNLDYLFVILILIMIVIV